MFSVTPSAVEGQLCVEHASRDVARAVQAILEASRDGALGSGIVPVPRLRSE